VSTVDKLQDALPGNYAKQPYPTESDSLLNQAGVAAEPELTDREILQNIQTQLLSIMWAANRRLLSREEVETVGRCVIAAIGDTLTERLGKPDTGTVILAVLELTNVVRGSKG
jgi:hypothetical protein